MSKRKILFLSMAIVILALISVWAFWERPDPQVERVKQLQAEMFKEDVAPEKRHEMFETLRKEMDQLSPQQREQVHQEMRQTFERRMDERIDAYFALPPAERVAYLDKQINEMEQRRKEFEARRGQMGQQGPPPGARPPGPPRSNNPGERTARRNMRLDNSTPAQRAKRAAYFADLMKRRAELGLPPLSGRRPHLI